MADVVYPAQPVEWTESRRVTWRAVLCGVAVGLASEFVLLVLGAAVGLTAFEPTEEVSQGVGVGYLIWLLVSLCASAFLGAWCSSVVAATTLKRNGLLHGLVTWAALTLIGLFVLSSGVVRMGRAAAQAVNVPTPSAENVVAGAQAAETELARPETRSQLDDIATGLAVGMWGLLLANLLPLGFALLGGVAGARSERRHLLPLTPTPRTFTPSTTQPQPV